MSIYTKTGDKGTTALYGGKRVLKSDIQIEAYGSIDELTSFIGLVITKLKKEDKEFFINIQKDLYQIMAVLAGDNKLSLDLKKQILAFEKKIDEIEKELPPLHHFILPGGTEPSGWFHVLRTICRRAERNVVAFSNNIDLEIENWKLEILCYLNRLSDLFFIFSRYYSKGKEVTL